MEIIGKCLTENHLDGLYIESYDGLLLARELGCKAFAGTGLNLTNAVSVSMIDSQVSYYAISKELSEREIAPLISSKAFVLSSGDIKIMDLCYCPFGKTCVKCDRKTHYILTDENGREFPVRRYLDAEGACRFEVYNCASLIGRGVDGAGCLLETTMQPQKALAVQAVLDENKQKKLYGAYTSGHLKNGVL